MGGEQRSSAQLDIRRHPATSSEGPIQVDRVQPDSVSGIRRLNNQIKGHGVERVFESALEESRTMWIRQHPAVAQTRVPYPGAAAAAGDGVTARRPDLKLRGATLRSGLREHSSAEQHPNRG